MTNDTEKIREKIRKLQNLANDQKGFPEGTLAEETIQKILNRYPNLEEEINNIKIIQWQNKFKHIYEIELWQMASKAHNIRIIKYNSEDNMEFISEGEEVDMIIARSEWEFACIQYMDMTIQIMRGIVNKLWPHICKQPKDVQGFKESPHSDLAEAARNKTIPFRKSIEGRT